MYGYCREKFYFTLLGVKKLNISSLHVGLSHELPALTGGNFPDFMYGFLVLQKDLLIPRLLKRNFSKPFL